MTHIHFDTEKDGFYGAYWECQFSTDCVIIAMLGDDPEDYMAKCAVKWLLRLRVNVLTMSPAKKCYDYHNYPIERVEAALTWAKKHGNKKFGIAGASTTGTLALTAASLIPDISLTVAMTPSDFIWQGFAQGNRDGCKEWPIENESLFTYRGKPLPYMPFCYEHPRYYQVMTAEAKAAHSMLASCKIFNDSEAVHPVTEDEFIKVENIKGKLVLIGAEDDTLWNTAKYIHRMKDRLDSHPHSCTAEVMVYKHGTHFVFPDSMLKIMLPIGSSLFVSLAFGNSKPYSKECKKTRIDIDNRMKKAIIDWKNS